uniref:NADH-ubiquinone oxidoreductase chain 2 n=1 Tax=Austropotamobius torrentium TaxID=94942 RepID=A0A1L6V0A7_AUSTO|nr:NADH dehydrogenase subunit 2 [Austropotamobius torrentium]APS87220.1 NADH dehydrogenase subunit 2 [Austropotamobius torrentium]
MVSPFNVLFFFTLSLGLMLSISSNSWFGAWAGLELNLMSFIPLISSSSNKYSSESALKYFLIQALASIVIIFSASFTLLTHNFIMLFSLSLLLKLGAAPFYFWFPQVVEGLNWLQVMILMTMQKIGPMVLLSYLMFDKYSFVLMFSSALLSALIGAAGGMNQTFLRKIMAFSSINHMSWMFFAMIMSEMCWLIYFLIYSLLSIMVIMNFYFQQAYHFSHLVNSGVPFIPKMISMMSLFSLGGLPPFLGFIPKWIVIQEMVIGQLFHSLVIILLSSLFTLYFYIRVSISFLTLIFPFSGWVIKEDKNMVSMPLMLTMNFFGLLIPSLYLIM